MHSCKAFALQNLIAYLYGIRGRSDLSCLSTASF
jgi:hypothetical protein